MLVAFPLGHMSQWSREPVSATSADSSKPVVHRPTPQLAGCRFLASDSPRQMDLEPGARGPPTFSSPKKIPAPAPRQAAGHSADPARFAAVLPAAVS
jgi:hypothetical protein